MKFREFIKESPVGSVGRTGILDAKAHISDEVMKEFNAVIKKMGGKTIARTILGGFKPEKKAELPSDIDSDNGVPEITLGEADLSPLQKEYQEYFEKLLKRYDASSPADMDEETMKKFFDEVSTGWIKGKGAK